MRSKKALVIENRLDEAEDFAAMLAEIGYDCDIAQAGDIGYSMLKKGNYGVAIVDNNLAGMTGHQIMTAARQNGLKTILIGVSRYVAVGERHEMVRKAADWYFEKGTDPEEIQAYIISAERARTGESPVLAYRSITINRNERTAWCNGKEMHLTAQVFDLLVLLMDNKGIYIPARRIQREICAGARTIASSAVRNAKQALAEELARCGEKDIIKQAHGKGYGIF